MRALFGLFIATVWLNAAQAEVSSLVAFDSATRDVIFAGNPAQGRLKAAAMGCNNCHGDQGQGALSNPSLAGHPATYIYKQLKDFQDKKRTSVMTALVNGLNDEDMADLSMWFASNPPNEARRDGGELAETLVYKGDVARDLPPCSVCHGEHSEGNQFDAATLVGQHRAVLLTQLRAFRTGKRTNDVYSRMRLIATKLTEAEIQAIVAYYSVEPIVIAPEPPIDMPKPPIDAPTQPPIDANLPEILVPSLTNGITKVVIDKEIAAITQKLAEKISEPVPTVIRKPAAIQVPSLDIIREPVPPPLKR